MSSDDIALLAVTIPAAGVAGLFIGSFLNVVVYRVPLGLSVSQPRSFCPTCRHQLSWWENVPVASWVGLRGRCRNCHQSISIRYPLVEITTGILFALVTWGWDGHALSAGYCILTATMIAVGLIEYGGQRAPLSVAAIGTGAALVLIVAGAGWEGDWSIAIGSLLGSLAASLIFALLRSADPQSADPRGVGRTAILVAGCYHLASIAASLRRLSRSPALLCASAGSRESVTGQRRTADSPPAGEALTRDRRAGQNPAMAASLVAKG